MKILNIMLLAIVMMILSACGGGGGGATPAAVTQTYTSLYVAGGGEAEVASVVGTGDDAVYTYNFKGTPIDVTLGGYGLEADHFVRITGGDIALLVGGTTYSYSRFGIAASNNFNSQYPIADDAEVFYVGQKTSSMPTTGSVLYDGRLATLVNGDFYYTNVNFNVYFGDKEILGRSGDSRNFKGTINGSDFSGTTSSGDFWDNGGTFSGSFFGPNAEELGGVGMVSDSEEGTFGFSFGAHKTAEL